MAREKILVTVKTYPLPSAKYMETVCTAGLKRDGTWIRLYPISYRHMATEEKFSKYQWIEANIGRNYSDPRPESYKIKGKIKPLGSLGTEKNWQKRKQIALKNVFTNLGSVDIH